VGGFDAERGQRLVHGPNDMQQRPAGLSGNLEHAHQPVAIRQRDYDKPGMIGQTRGDWFAHCQPAQEVGGHSEVGSGGKIPDACMGAGSDPISAEGIVVFRGGVIREFTFEPGQQDLIGRVELESERHGGTNSTRFSQSVAVAAARLHSLAQTSPVPWEHA